MRGIGTEGVVKKVFPDPQGEMTNGESCWVKIQVMQEASSSKSGLESLWSINEQVAHKWPSPMQNTI